MRHLFLSFIIILVAIPGIAQKTKTKGVTFNYMHYPKSPLPLNIKTYSVETSNTSTRMKIGSDRESQYLVLQGFKQVETSEADVRLVFELYGIQTNVDIKEEEKTEKVNDKEVKVKYYYYQIISSISGKFTITDKLGSSIYENKFSGSKYQNVLKSGLFKTKADAQAEFNKKKKNLINLSDNNAVDNALTSIKNHMDNEYAYFMTSMNESVATGKGKKYDYSDLDEAQEKFLLAVDYFNNRDTADYAKVANECITIWEKALEELDPKSKKTRISKKNGDWFYRNIATAYLYLEEFDKAIEAMNKAFEIDKGFLGKHQMAEIKDRKYRFEKNQERIKSNL